MRITGRFASEETPFLSPEHASFRPPSVGVSLSIYDKLHKIFQLIKKKYFWNRGRDSVVGIATWLASGWKVWGSKPYRGEIFRTRPNRPWGPPSLLYHGYRFHFPGIKRPGRGNDHPPTSSTEVKESLKLYLYSPSGPSWPVPEWTLPLLYLYLTSEMWKCWQ